MNKTIQRALEEAEKRLEAALPNIERKQKKANKKELDEPDHLRSAVSIDELEVKRLTKEQGNEDSTQ